MTASEGGRSEGWRSVEQRSLKSSTPNCPARAGQANGAHSSVLCRREAEHQGVGFSEHQDVLWIVAALPFDDVTI